MVSTPSVPASMPGQERRRQVRVAFSPVRRPRLRLDDGVYDILDASLDGLRVRHADPTRPPVGDLLTGYLEWPGLDEPLAIEGKVVRVELTELALTYDGGQLPVSYILAEAARRRDVREAAAED